MICSKAYEKGISVPKPLGMFNILHPETNKKKPAFVLQYIKGSTLNRLVRSALLDENCFEFIDKKKIVEKWNHIKDLYEKELKKAESLGFINNDNNYGNGIWNLKEGKVYLIDFGRWEIRK